MENNKIIITDELVGAYLEGNTTPEETLLILQAIKNDLSCAKHLICPCVSRRNVKRWSCP